MNNSMKDVYKGSKVVSNSKKHKMIIRCYNGKELSSDVDYNAISKLEGLWSPKSKAKKTMDEIPFELLEPRDMINKMDINKTTFAYNVKTLLESAASYLNTKYKYIIFNDEYIRQESAKEYNDLVKEESDKCGRTIRSVHSEKYDLYLDNDLTLAACCYDMLSIHPLSVIKETRFNEIQQPTINMIFEAQSYTTSDPTIVDDFTTMYLSILINDITSRFGYSYFHLSEELLKNVINIYNAMIEEMYDTYYIIFSKCMVMAYDCYNYCQYKSITDYTNKDNNEVIEVKEEE